MKNKYKGSEGKFKTLDKTDLNNLTKLKASNYTNEEFEHAFKAMCNSKWVNENNMITPAHFLRVDNFMKYVNIDIEHKVEELTDDQQLYRNVMAQINNR